MTTVHHTHRHLHVACELDAAEFRSRAEEWRRVREQAIGASALPDGGRLLLPPETWATAEDLVRREAACCGFLDLDLRRDGDVLRLDITSPVPEGRAVAAGIVGLAEEGTIECC